MLSLNDVSNLTDIAFPTLTDWAKRGVIRPLAVRGRSRKFDRIGVLVASVTKALRKQGLSLDTIEPVAKYIGELSEGDIISAVSGGTPFLLFDGDRPRFVATASDVSRRSTAATVLIFVNIAEALHRVDNAMECHRTYKRALAMTA